MNNANDKFLVPSQPSAPNNFSFTMSAPLGKKLRTACDICHQGKMKCSGGTPCNGCQESGYHCSYSFSQRLGRPKGKKNKRSHDLMNKQHVNSNLAVSRAASNTQQVRDPDSATSDTGDTIFPVFNDILAETDTQEISYSFLNTGPFWDSIGTNSGGEFENVDIISTEKQPSASAQQNCVLEASAPSMDFERVAYTPLSRTLNSTGTATSGQNLSYSLNGVYNGETQQNPLQPLSLLLSDPPTSCDCFETHVDLLRRLKELEKDSDASLTFDSVLTGAREALVPWKRLIDCPVCQNEDDQGVLLLSAMSIRAILRRLQRLCAENKYWEKTDNGKGSMTMGTIMVGNYEATGEQQFLVMDVLILHTLGKIKSALLSLREKLEQSRQRTNGEPEPTSLSTAVMAGGPASYDRGCMEDMLRSLENTVQIVEKSVRNTFTPSR